MPSSYAIYSLRLLQSGHSLQQYRFVIRLAFSLAVFGFVMCPIVYLGSLCAVIKSRNFLLVLLPNHQYSWRDVTYRRLAVGKPKGEGCTRQSLVFYLLEDDVFRRLRKDKITQRAALCTMQSIPEVCTAVVMNDRLFGLVVRVPGYRYRGPGSIPGATRFSEK
jgi:hypothetical protein